MGVTAEQTLGAPGDERGGAMCAQNPQDDVGQGSLELSQSLG